MRIGAALIAAAAAAWLASAPAALAWPAEATRELAVREGPSMDYPHIEVIQPGSVVDVHHCNVERVWCKVTFGGTSGYLRGQYLQRLGDVYLGPRVDLYVGVGPRPRYYGPPGPYYYDRPYGHWRRY